MAGWLSGYTKRIKITIDYTKVTATLTNFPLLVKLSSSSGITANNITNIFTDLVSDANYNKIMVMTADNVTQCYVEVQSYSTSAETAYLWVKVPSVSSTVDTVLYLYYDTDMAANTTYVGLVATTPAKAVWNSNYKIVTHLEQDPSGTAPQVKDSTTNAKNGTSAGTMTTSDLVPAKINNGLDFDGSNDKIDFGDAFVASTLMVEAIVYFNTISPSVMEYLVSKMGSSGEWYLHLGSDNKFKFQTYNGATAYSVIGTTVVSASTWYHVVGVADGANLKIYVNGILEATATQSLAISDTAMLVTYGWDGNSSANRQLNGRLDEVRISSPYQSNAAAYAKASYNSAWDTLVTFSQQQIGNQYVGNLSNSAECYADVDADVYCYGIKGVIAKCYSDVDVDVYCYGIKGAIAECYADVDVDVYCYGIKGVIAKCYSDVDIDVYCYGIKGAIAECYADINVDVYCYGYKGITAECYADIDIDVYCYGKISTTAGIVIVLNLKNGSHTEYNNYSFNSFAKYNGKYYGANSNGLFLLEGVLDGATEIDCFAKTGDIDTWELTPIQRPTVRSNIEAWASMATNGALEVDVIGITDGTNTYPIDTNGRIKIGKGLKDRFRSFTFKNIDGSSLWIENVRLKAINTKRVR